KVNEKFLGASQLIIIAEGKAYCTEGGKPCAGDGCKLCHPEEPGACGTETCEQRQGAIKDAETLNHLDLFGRYMAERPEVGGTVTAATLLKKIFRTFHEADPKWEMLPTRNDHVSQLFFLLTSGTRRGEMDRFFDMNYTNATITVFYRDCTHETIENSIARAKQYIREHEGEASAVRYRLAGGLIGILAAVNEEVEWSYRVNLALILAVVFCLSYATYVSFLGALIVMLPSLVAQPLSEAVMYLFGIDMNINSLPVAAVGIGIGIDYGYYVLSRIVEELCAGEGFDVAIRRMFETTGKTVLFTGVSLTASIIFWVFFPMKFQADMALLLVLLLGFHLMGALMFIPPMVSLFKPRFAIKYAEERQRIRAEAAAAEVKDLLPPEIYSHFKNGDYTNKLVDFPNSKWAWDDGFDEATKWNAEHLVLDEQKSPIDKATGKRPEYIRGLPFPNIDPKDPDAGYKALWNLDYAYYTGGNSHNWTLLNWVSRSGIDRSSVQDVYFLYYDGQPRHYSPPKNPENLLFQFLAATTSPADLQGTAALGYRFKDPTKRDLSWAYVPALRRVRAVSPANRSDGSLGSDMSQDDGFFFA